MPDHILAEDVQSFLRGLLNRRLFLDTLATVGMLGPLHRRGWGLGQRTIDFRRILARREQAGIRHVFVEHDDPPEPLAFAQASYDYLKALKPAKSR
jgi:hypothetical protein